MIPNGDTSIPQSYRLMQTTKQPELQYWEKKLSLQVKSYLTVTACFINNDRGLQWLIADKGKLMELLVFHYNNIFNVYFMCEQLHWSQGCHACLLPIFAYIKEPSW